MKALPGILRGVFVWAVLTALVVGLLLTFAVQHYGQSRYDDGRRSVLQAAHFDGALLAAVRRADSIAKAKTDTVVRRVTVTRYRVDTLLQRVPDSLLVVPEIAALASTTHTLLAQVDTLTYTLDIERAVSRLRTDADSAALVSARVVIIAQADSLHTLAQRPTRRAQLLTGVTMAAIGFVVGVLR
jgi:hypothetical protein